MNVAVVFDPENDNYLTQHFKWSPHMFKAKLFTSVKNAQKIRSSYGKKINKKLKVKEFELTYLGER
jgi:hypothetical protein